MPIHMADIGSDNFEQEFTLSLMQNEEGTLERDRSRLERIEDGTYGIARSAASGSQEAARTPSLTPRCASAALRGMKAGSLGAANVPGSVPCPGGV